MKLFPEISLKAIFVLYFSILHDDISGRFQKTFPFSFPCHSSSNCVMCSWPGLIITAILFCRKPVRDCFLLSGYLEESVNLYFALFRGLFHRD